MEDTQSLFDFYSMRDVAENFSLDELLNFARQNKLQEWFAGNFYLSEAHKVDAAIHDGASDSDLKLLLCKIFAVPLETLSANETKEISLTVAKNHHRELFIKKFPDDRKAQFVEKQGELVHALKDEAKIIFLRGGEFRIPLNRRGVTYIGCENAIVDFDEENDIDLDACEIILEDVQVYLRHAINFHAAKSNNIKLIDGSKKTLGDRPTLKEIFDTLRGRKAFESPANFKHRAENVRGIAVGVVLLDDKDYNFNAAQFTFKPSWDFEYIAVLKDFVAGKNFSLKLSPKDAALLYNNERKLQIFADLTYQDGKLTILNLYLCTKTLGKLAIIATEHITSANSGGGLGYGLEIITDIPTSIPNIKVQATTFIRHSEGDRLASILYEKAHSFKSDIQIETNGRIVNARVFGGAKGLLSLNLTKDTEVTIIAKGPDSKEAVTALTALIDFARW